MTDCILPLVAASATAVKSVPDKCSMQVFRVVCAEIPAVGVAEPFLVLRENNPFYSVNPNSAEIDCCSLAEYKKPIAYSRGILQYTCGVLGSGFAFD